VLALHLAGLTHPPIHHSMQTYMRSPSEASRCTLITNPDRPADVTKLGACCKIPDNCESCRKFCSALLATDAVSLCLHGCVKWKCIQRDTHAEHVVQWYTSSPGVPKMVHLAVECSLWLQKSSPGTMPSSALTTISPAS
jgi:hypothetical protein